MSQRQKKTGLLSQGNGSLGRSTPTSCPQSGNLKGSFSISGALESICDNDHSMIIWCVVNDPAFSDFNSALCVSLKTFFWQKGNNFAITETPVCGSSSVIHILPPPKIKCWDPSCAEPFKECQLFRSICVNQTIFQPGPGRRLGRFHLERLCLHLTRGRNWNFEFLF